MNEHIVAPLDERQVAIRSQLKELNPAFERAEKTEKLNRMLNQVMPDLIQAVIIKTSEVWFDSGPVECHSEGNQLPELGDDYFDSVVTELSLNQDLKVVMELYAHWSKWPLSGNPDEIAAVGVGIEPKDNNIQRAMYSSSFHNQLIFNKFLGQPERSAWEYSGPDDPDKFARMIDFICENLNQS